MDFFQSRNSIIFIRLGEEEVGNAIVKSNFNFSGRIQQILFACKLRKDRI